MLARKSRKSPKRDFTNPKEFYNLFENECESDLTLLVGQEGWQERVPAHSWVLANGSDYFKALLQGPFAKSGTTVHRFPDDPKGFNNLVRWLYQNKCDLQSLQSSLDTLSVAIKYLCPDLAERCIVQITNQLTAENVLRVLGWIYFYCANYPYPQPSAPSLNDFEETVEDKQLLDDRDRDPTISCHILLNECLDLIDKETDQVLNSEYLCFIDLPVLNMILKRDTLNVSSELKVIKALHKWSTAACKKEQMPLTLENKRKVLGTHLYLARLLTITPSEVQTLSMKYSENVGLLTNEELTFIEQIVCNKNSSNSLSIPKEMEPFVPIMRLKRKTKETPKSLSAVNSSTALKKKMNRMKKFNKKEIILDLVAILGLLFD